MIYLLLSYICSYFCGFGSVLGICRNPCVGFLCFPFCEGPHQVHLPSSSEMQCVLCLLRAQGRPFETLSPEFLLRADHVDVLCLSNSSLSEGNQV